MLPVPKSYAIWPAVVEAGKTTEMTVAPMERAFLLFENETYTVTIIPVDGDEISYYEPSAFDVITAQAHDGALKFAYHFAGEMEYNVRLHLGEKLLQEMNVYAVGADLYALRPMRGDLHAHSYRSDGKRDPAALAGHYREQGYDFFALTDHNRFYPGSEIDEVYDGVKTGFLRIRGEEIHTPVSVVHIVHVGGRYSVAEKYVHHREQYEQEVAALEPQVPAHVPEAFRGRYAMAMWATQKIHEAGGLAIYVHPYWKPAKSGVHNVKTDFAKLLLTSGMFDAYELCGGMLQHGNNMSVALWNDLRAEGLRIPVVGSSDVHGLEKSVSFPHLFTIAFAKDDSHDAVIDAVRAGNTVAVEATGDEYGRHYRSYGSLRLVMYAQFLLRYYFPEQQRVCQGGGVAMRAYAMNDADATLVEMLAEQAERFRNRFFGREQPKLPDAEMHDFELRWRERQLAGPLGKGSAVISSVLRQI